MPLLSLRPLRHYGAAVAVASGNRSMTTLQRFRRRPPRQ